MPGKKSPSRTAAKDGAVSSPPPTISPRWLFTAILIVLVAAAVCAWGTLCLLFWQGSWQLLYHPKSAIERTPHDLEIDYNAVAFATNESGEASLDGWWIPAVPSAPLSRYTLLYLHGATGNMGDAVDSLAKLHGAGVNVFAFDYRGYGESKSARPSEAHWRQDAGSALVYLTQTRHIDPHSIILVGKELGANLALEVAASHPDLAGVALDCPVEDAANIIFSDPRARLIPAHLLAADRYNLQTAASALRVPSLWLLDFSTHMSAFEKVRAPKTLDRVDGAGRQSADEIALWLAGADPMARKH